MKSAVVVSVESSRLFICDIKSCPLMSAVNV